MSHDSLNLQPDCSNYQLNVIASSGSVCMELGFIKPFASNGLHFRWDKGKVQV